MRLLNCLLLGRARARRHAHSERHNSAAEDASQLFDYVERMLGEHHTLLACRADDGAKTVQGPNAQTMLALLENIEHPLGLWSFSPRHDVSVTPFAGRFDLALHYLELAITRWGWRRLDYCVIAFVLSFAIRDACVNLVHDRTGIGPNPNSISNGVHVPPSNVALFTSVDRFLRLPLAAEFWTTFRPNLRATCAPEPASWADVHACAAATRAIHEREQATRIAGALRRLGLHTAELLTSRRQVYRRRRARSTSSGSTTVREDAA